MCAGHSFCSTCGVPVLNQVDESEGRVDILPINMRTLNNVKFDGLKIRKLNGKDVGNLREERKKRAGQR